MSGPREPTDEPDALIQWLDPDGTILATLRAPKGKAAPLAVTAGSHPPGDLPPLAKRIGRAVKYLARMPAGVQGSDGSGATYAAATALVHGFCLDEHSALSVLLDAYNPRCVPPWSESELRHKVSDAATKSHARERGWLLRDKLAVGKDSHAGPLALPAPAAPTPATAEPAARQSATPPVVPPVGAALETLPVGRSDAPDDCPHRLADAVLAGYTAAGRPTLTHYRGEFHRWACDRYQPRPADAFDAEVNRTCRRELDAAYAARIDAWDGDGTPPAWVKVTGQLVTNVTKALGSRLNRDIDDAPAWIRGAAGADPREMVAARNGLVHLPLYATGSDKAVSSNTPDFFNFNAVDYAVNPAAPTPAAWLAFLATLWPDDPESVALLQEWFGYLLTPDSRQQKMLLLVGPPRSGKGTIARVLQELVGPANVGNPTLGSLGGDFGLESLVGKSVAVIEDARLSKRTDSAVVCERLLTISGGGNIDVNRKFKAHFSGRLTTRFVVCTNELPDLTDASGALASRWCLLRLTQSFLGREDDALVDRLLVELPGIFNWAAAGWLRLQGQRKFTAPEASRDLAEDLHDQGSPVGEFVTARCRVGPTRTVEVKEIYAAWQSWCTTAGRKESGTVSQFGRQLRAYLHAIKKTRPRGNERITSYSGIDIRPVFDDEADDETPHERTHRLAQSGGVAGPADGSAGQTPIRFGEGEL